MPRVSRPSVRRMRAAVARVRRAGAGWSPRGSVSAIAAGIAIAPDHLTASRRRTRRRRRSATAGRTATALGRHGADVSFGCRVIGVGASASMRRRRLGGATVDPAPVAAAGAGTRAPPRTPGGCRAARSATCTTFSPLDRDQQAGANVQTGLREQQLGHERREHGDADAGERRREPPSERAHAEQLDAEPDRQLAERRMHPRAHVPLVLEPVRLVAGLDQAARRRMPSVTCMHPALA